MSSIIKVDTIQDQDGNNIINENANTITIGASGDTITIPSGATLANNGTATGFASIAWQSSIVTGSTLSAVAGKGYWIDTTSNACTVTLPGSASVGDQIIFVDYARKWGTNAVTLNLNSLNYQGYSSPNPVYDTNGETVSIVYSGATKGWIPVDDGAVAWETPQTASVEYLVVAGGGSGGKSNGAGAGAGGYLTNYGTSTITFNPGTVYTITVGGGAAAQASNTSGTNGSNSVLSGSDIATVTAIGGGYGGFGSVAGGSGGSGGGGGTGGSQPGGTGTVGQGNDGGSGADAAPQYGSGGGGGAGAVGGNGSGSAGGNGGDGLSNSITGSGTYYAGGGGGAADNSNPACGSGGLGGGGAATTSGSPGVSGTVNTGGGGGATHVGTTSGAGGSGVVILRMPTASYSGTTTGSPTVTTDGTDTILTYTASGSYTQ